MSGLNSEGNRRMQAVFDKSLGLPRSDQAFFFAGVYGKVMSLVLLGSVADNLFVEKTEAWLAEVMEMIEKRPK